MPKKDKAVNISTGEKKRKMMIIGAVVVVVVILFVFYLYYSKDTNTPSAVTNTGGTTSTSLPSDGKMNKLKVDELQIGDWVLSRSVDDGSLVITRPGTNPVRLYTDGNLSAHILHSRTNINAGGNIIADDHVIGKIVHGNNAVNSGGSMHVGSHMIAQGNVEGHTVGARNNFYTPGVIDVAGGWKIVPDATNFAWYKDDKLVSMIQSHGPYWDNPAT